MADAKLYELVVCGSKHLLVSNSSCYILRALKQANYLTYPQLVLLSKVPIASLYVFIARLEAAGLVLRVQKLSGQPFGKRTVVEL
jgi:hypothetical protein